MHPSNDPQKAQPSKNGSGGEKKIAPSETDFEFTEMVSAASFGTSAIREAIKSKDLGELHLAFRRGDYHNEPSKLDFSLVPELVSLIAEGLEDFQVNDYLSARKLHGGENAHICDVDFTTELAGECTEFAEKYIAQCGYEAQTILLARLQTELRERTPRASIPRLFTSVVDLYLADHLDPQTVGMMAGEVITFLASVKDIDELPHTDAIVISGLKDSLSDLIERLNGTSQIEASEDDPFADDENFDGWC